MHMSKLAVTIQDETFEVELDSVGERRSDGERNSPTESNMDSTSEIEVRVNGEPFRILVPAPTAPSNEIEWLVIDGRPYEMLFDPDLRWIQSQRTKDWK